MTTYAQHYAQCNRKNQNNKIATAYGTQFTTIENIAFDVQINTCQLAEIQINNCSVKKKLKICWRF